MLAPHSARPAFFASLAVLLAALGGCSFLYPEPDPEVAEPSDAPLFEPDYYAKNAKEYFHGEKYGKARGQWEQQLRLQPDEVMPKMGMAYCDYYLGRQASVRGDFAFAKDRLDLAEQGFRGIWSGRVPESTRSSAPEDNVAWRAALGLAMSLRGLGQLNGRLADLTEQRAQALAPDDPKRAQAATESGDLQQKRWSNYRASLDLFERLATMEGASPEAVKHLAEIYVLVDRVDDAEIHYRRYLEMAKDTLASTEQVKENLPEQYVANPGNLRIATEIIDEKLASNREKQVQVMVDLGGIFFAAGQHAKTLEYLLPARDLMPDRLDILVKIAQCEAELGQLESAIANLDQFIRKSSQDQSEWSEDIARAYRLKEELEMRKGDVRR